MEKLTDDQIQTLVTKITKLDCQISTNKTLLNLTATKSLYIETMRLIKELDATKNIFREQIQYWRDTCKKEKIRLEKHFRRAGFH